MFLRLPIVSAAMTRATDVELYARSFVDVYDRWYEHLHDAAQVVEAFGPRVDAGATLLELGSGTGRLTWPFVDAGYDVIALDVSLEMLDADRSGSGRVAANMAVLPISPGAVDGVFIAYNTLFNLADGESQRRCPAEIARVLRPPGIVAIEAFVAPDDPEAPFGLTVVHHHTHPDGRTAIATWQGDDDPSRIVGAHIELRPDGIHSRPWELRYLSPTSLDELASSVGLALVDRHADWLGTPFETGDVRHVSWYRLA